MPRFYCPVDLQPGAVLELPAGAARHAQVLRLQPGAVITLFNGQAQAPGVYGEYEATVTQMGRSNVQVRVGAFAAATREPARQVHLTLGVPANERMDWLVEKAAELGVATIQPLMTERSVLRLSGERADRKVAHWQSIAQAACEQCGGNRVPQIWPVQPFTAWLVQTGRAQHTGLLLSLRDGTQGLRGVSCGDEVTFVSGPEGGLSAQEEDAALAAGFAPVTLGPRVLRAETAALVALATMLV
ncbi:MAG: 16S rRNA (uracil(1498)-N(3))-methyltransferase [Comamonadaceae bacterium CG1_02_60_18]|nr:MAG: 16S rRNA (uracil(1498)-N(3))-methyltransferase [Comamonadaceae bacterium CG1_02_60_18]PIQ55605.1 MAG: 16S rRNA (uracil(1498)-N(3))-methyltransferase [Comamonadaceae bacterium CG12_big_fil_rev_8_21_14_0_65_59_15]